MMLYGGGLALLVGIMIAKRRKIEQNKPPTFLRSGGVLLHWLHLLLHKKIVGRLIA